MPGRAVPDRTTFEKAGSVASCHSTSGLEAMNQPPFQGLAIGSGATRVQSTTLWGRGSPDATPRANTVPYGVGTGAPAATGENPKAGAATSRPPAATPPLIAVRREMVGSVTVVLPRACNVPVQWSRPG